MGCSVSVKVVYGVKSDLDHFLEDKVIQKPATCHPSKVKKGDKFCPECGEPTINKETLRIKPQFENFLPPMDREEIPGDWFIFGAWPGTSLDLIQYAYDHAPVLGYLLCESDDLMYGNNGAPSLFNTEHPQIQKTKDLLLQLGFEETDIGFYMLGEVSC